MTSDRPFTCAVVGLGGMGGQHAKVLARLPQVHLAVCCDLNPEARVRCPSGVPFTTSLEDALATPGLQGVVVATPDNDHRGVVVEALRRGIDVLCEKPIATTLADADDMILAEQSSTAQLTIGHIVRFDPRYRVVQQAVASGSLGRPRHVTTRRNNSIVYGRRLADRTSLAMYLSVHDLDIMEWIVDSPVKRVYAEAATGGELQGAETLVAVLRFANGAVATHEVCWALPEDSGFSAGEFAFSFVGTKGVAYVEIRSEGVTIYGGVSARPQDEAPRADRNWGMVSYPSVAFNHMIGDIPAGILRAQLEHFVAASIGRSAPMVTSRDGRRALAIALSLEQSLDSGQPIAVPD